MAGEDCFRKVGDSTKKGGAQTNAPNDFSNHTGLPQMVHNTAVDKAGQPDDDGGLKIMCFWRIIE